jgi:hypothetical protein
MRTNEHVTLPSPLCKALRRIITVAYISVERYDRSLKVKAGPTRFTCFKPAAIEVVLLLAGKLVGIPHLRLLASRAINICAGPQRSASGLAAGDPR